MATNDSFTISDAIGAAFIGGLGAYGKIGSIFAGMVAFSYSFDNAYSASGNIYLALLSGLVSGGICLLSSSKYLQFDDKVSDVIVNTVFTASSSLVDATVSVIANSSGKSNDNSKKVVTSNSHLRNKNNAMNNIFMNKFNNRYGLI